MFCRGGAAGGGGGGAVSGDGEMVTQITGRGSHNPRVTIGHLRAIMGHLSLTIGNSRSPL